PFFKREIAVSLRVCIKVRNGHQSNDNQTWKHDSCQPRIEVDEHFLQSEEIPRGFRGIRRTGWVRRIFQRRLQCHRPTDQDYREHDHTDQFGVNQVRPGQNLVRCFFLLDERLSVGNTLVVPDGFTHGEPREEGHKEQHSDDRHIVRLGDNQPKIWIQYAQAEKQEHRTKYDDSGFIRVELMRILQRDKQQDRGCRNQPIRRSKKIDNFFDEHLFLQISGTWGLPPCPPKFL